MGIDDIPNQFENKESVNLDLKVIDNGRIITLSGHARGYKLYLKRFRLEEGGYKYEAEINDRVPERPNAAEELFEKYYELVKYKSRL